MFGATLACTHEIEVTQSRQATSLSRAAWTLAHVVPHEPWVRCRMARKIRADHDLDDVIQEAYLRLLHIGSIAHIRDPRAYFWRAASSVLNSYRRRGRLVKFEPLEESDSHIAEECAPEARVDSRNCLNRLGKAWNDMPERWQRVLELRRMDGLSLSETAAWMEVSVSAVEKQQSAALRALADACSWRELISN